MAAVQRKIYIGEYEIEEGPVSVTIRSKGGGPVNTYQKDFLRELVKTLDARAQKPP